MAKLSTLLRDIDINDLDQFQLKREAWSNTDKLFNADRFFTPKYTVHGYWYGLIHHGCAEPYIDMGVHDDWFIYTRKELS